MRVAPRLNGSGRSVGQSKPGRSRSRSRSRSGSRSGSPGFALSNRSTTPIQPRRYPHLRQTTAGCVAAPSQLKEARPSTGVLQYWGIQVLGGPSTGLPLVVPQDWGTPVLGYPSTGVPQSWGTTRGSPVLGPPSTWIPQYWSTPVLGRASFSWLGAATQPAVVCLR